MSSGVIISEAHRTSAHRALRLRRILTFPVVLAALLGLLAVMSARNNLNDPDMWWHLKTGEVIWTTHSIPTTDIFSYTTNHQPWIPQEWLSQLSMYAAFKMAGFSGLMVWLCLCGATLFIAGYTLCCLYTDNPKISLLGALTIWLFSTIGFAPRPQMIGYILLLCELLLIHRGRTRNPKWFFGLPILFVIWINSHGSFLLGMVVAVVFLLVSCTPFRAGLLVSAPWQPGTRKTFLVSVGISTFALLCNPVGINQILYPINTLLHQPIGIAQVQEWQPLPLTETRGIALMAILACIFLTVILRRAEILWEELLLLAVGTWLAVSHTRLIFVFGILVAPILCRLLSDFWDGYRVELERPIPNAVLIAGSILVGILVFPSRASIDQQLQRDNPVAAVQFMKANHVSGRMLNEYVYGGYLIWAAPDHPVFVDGRADVFEWTGVLSDFARWEGLTEDPRLLLDKYRVDLCLLARTSPMVTVMNLLPGWKLVYSDDRAVIFARLP